jgi:hypothetical protein
MIQLREDKEGRVVEGQEGKVQDVFGPEEGHQIQYKTLSWQVHYFP